LNKLGKHITYITYNKSTMINTAKKIVQNIVKKSERTYKDAWCIDYESYSSLLYVYNFLLKINNIIYNQKNKNNILDYIIIIYSFDFLTEQKRIHLGKHTENSKIVYCTFYNTYYINDSEHTLFTTFMESDINSNNKVPLKYKFGNNFYKGYRILDFKYSNKSTHLPKMNFK